MSTTPSIAAGVKKKKKNQPAPPDLVKAVGALFDIAAKAPPPSATSDGSRQIVRNAGSCSFAAGISECAPERVDHSSTTI